MRTTSLRLTLLAFCIKIRRIQNVDPWSNGTCMNGHANSLAMPPDDPDLADSHDRWLLRMDIQASVKHEDGHV